MKNHIFLVVCSRELTNFENEVKLKFGSKVCDIYFKCDASLSVDLKYHEITHVT